MQADPELQMIDPEECIKSLSGKGRQVADPGENAR